MNTRDPIEIFRQSLLIDGRPEDTRVVVAMSGGVDSSVVAALARRAGYDVVGITMQLYDDGGARPRPGACCAGQDIHDARRVAEALDIPHYVLDYESRFRASVMNQFADSYIAGETPVPCVLCNQEVKFKPLLATARELGAAVLATGHYVAMRRVGDGVGLFRPADAARDQSYFLFSTPRAELEHLRFPLGGLSKLEVREAARGFGLPIAEKRDSQDICFVAAGRYAEIIERLRPGAAEPGEIVDLKGRVLGRHDGIIRFTIGQRRGLGIPTGEPLYVVGLDPERRQVVVGPRTSLRTDVIMLKSVNWLGEGRLEDVAADGLGVHVRVRSSQPPQAATLQFYEGVTHVRLTSAEYGVARGQACVFYDSDAEGARVLGGGWIDGTVSAASMGDQSAEPGAADGAAVVGTGFRQQVR